MAVLLDTTSLPWGQRADAVCAALATNLTPASVSAAAGARSRISRWDLGPGADLLHHVSGGHRLTRTGRHLRSDTPERISLGLPRSGSVRLKHRDLPYGDRIGELQLVDLTSPYDFLVDGPAELQAVIVDYAQLGLTVDAVRSAIPRLPGSPLYEMTRRHLHGLPAVIDALPPGPALAMLGSSTTELIRALIASCAVRPDEWAVEAVNGTLFLRLTAFIRQHQREPDLSAARLAAVHAVSVRAVYTAFAQQGEQLAEWVMRGRLEGARKELARLPSGAGAIGRVAHGWGFKDARHFARRFRAAYDVSPREWQQLSALSS
ncbi:AraC family transcriptional regulator [Dactylosporangium sp. NPDC005572]|uniref:AraC family transcriptional regulator n=1 Tax=Dactylosporangium sp. NPDC005572 TaxID=3156889 RepID=UPI0033A5F9E9